MKMTFDVDEIRVASPCQARWNDMTGDERTRFCGQCQKHVYNLSAMTRKQIASLVREKEGKFCGRFYRRPDGRLLTADCPSRVRRIRARLAKIGGALCALVLSVIGCSPRQTNQSGVGRSGGDLMGKVAVPSPVYATNRERTTMGFVALPHLPRDTNVSMRIGQISVVPHVASSRHSR